MCGIYGVVYPLRTDRPDPSLMARMGRVMTHRGPDDEGHYVTDGAAIGMRRLSIIDVAGGHQPISNEDGTVWVVCNGEIYNFPELRRQLESRGHVFSCNSDVEVIVHLYEEEGPELFKRLRGMFAAAVWDVRLSRLVLGRDRLGKKPLYVRREPNRILFASEIKAILQADSVSPRIDPVALHEYLGLGYVPAPLTLFEGIEKILPGHCVVIEKGRIEDRQYWDVRFDDVRSGSEEEWIERVRAKVFDAVKVRLMSDVPLGAFLSGGIDSSTIVAAMARATDSPVKTYSIGFDASDKFYDELPYARLVAQAYATDHHEIIVRPDVANLLLRLVWHMDEPIADSAFITTYLVAQLAGESVKVILSGVGGDELFGGYRRYLGDRLNRYYQMLPATVRRTLLPRAIAALPQDRHSRWRSYVRYADAFLKSAELDPQSRYMSYITVFSPDVRAALLKAGGPAGAPSAIVNEYFRRAGDVDSLSRIVYVDLKTSLADDLLLLTDKMTMAASIECRAPLVDHELVELTAGMPSNLKVRGLSMKYLLKKVAEPWLPRQILRRPKRGFGAPIGAWFRRDLETLIDDTLSESQVRKRGLLDPKVVAELIARHRLQQTDNTDHLLALVTLELWCRIFLDRAEAWDSAPSLDRVAVAR